MVDGRTDTYWNLHGFCTRDSLCPHTEKNCDGSNGQSKVQCEASMYAWVEYDFGKNVLLSSIAITQFGTGNFPADIPHQLLNYSSIKISCVVDDAVVQFRQFPIASVVVRNRSYTRTISTLLASTVHTGAPSTFPMPPPPAISKCDPRWDQPCDRTVP